MGFLETMKERGLVAQVTHEEELSEHLAGKKRSAYIGFDPTAASLHVGHLMQIMTLRRWQQAGGRVIAIVGGGTALIGDPTGKSEMRQMITIDTIRANMEGIKAQIGKFVDFSSPDKGIMLNNADWLFKLEYLPFLREIGPHFSVNRMLTAESVKQRLEKGLSFLEFNYMLLQAYDFLHLYRTHDCTLQMGGDDQWSNILAGMELVRRFTHGQAFCLTTHLWTTADGRKMGKTEKGAVWLDPGLTSPYDYFQFWRNVEDSVVKSSLAIFTELPMSEVNRLGDLKDAAINEAKLVLAYEQTKMLHGAAEADKARDAAAQLFAGGSADFGADAPEHLVSAQDFGTGMALLDFLVAAQIAPSKGEAKRLVQQGGLSINGEKVEDMNHKVEIGAFKDEGSPKSGERGGGASGRSLLLRKGKKHYYRIRISP